MNTFPPLAVSPAGLAMIRAFESFSATPYLCPGGKRTIGYGHALRPSDEALFRVTEGQAEALLIEDLAPVTIYLNAVLPALAQHEVDALASFCFNVGLGAFEKSTLFARLKAGDKAGAASQFGAWVHANGQVLRGLVKRRAAERSLFLGGKTP